MHALFSTGGRERTRCFWREYLTSESIKLPIAKLPTEANVTTQRGCLSSAPREKPTWAYVFRQRIPGFFFLNTHNDSRRRNVNELKVFQSIVLNTDITSPVEIQ